MREAAFLKKNEQKWREVEKILDKDQEQEPDETADLFITLTDDLSYAKTNYTNSKTTDYLNSLAAGIYQKINKPKKETFSKYIDFWKIELPLAFAKSHRQLLYAFIFFVICVAIGAVSTAYDESFIRVVLGDRYVDMTLENIDKGDPMAVYKAPDAQGMFMAITINNIKVSIMTFIAGIVFSVGTYYILFNNGVMLGAFQNFFYKKGLLWETFLTIWIHGTIEISCIVMAGAAGIVLGNSFLFPGTFKRMTSLVRGAKQAVKVLLGIVPLIILAGFLESFVTRLTELHWSIRLSIILGSLTFILWYFVVYPIILKKRYEG